MLMCLYAPSAFVARGKVSGKFLRGSCAVAHRVLYVLPEFGESLLLPFGNKHRVVAKTFRPAFPACDNAFDNTLEKMFLAFLY